MVSSSRPPLVTTTPVCHKEEKYESDLWLLLTFFFFKTAKPTFDLKGRAKWDAWTANKGKQARKKRQVLFEK